MAVPIKKLTNKPKKAEIALVITKSNPLTQLPLGFSIYIVDNLSVFLFTVPI